MALKEPKKDPNLPAYNPDSSGFKGYVTKVGLLLAGITATVFSIKNDPIQPLPSDPLPLVGDKVSPVQDTGNDSYTQKQLDSGTAVHAVKPAATPALVKGQGGLHR